jgi:hypothetical protein
VLVTFTPAVARGDEDLDAPSASGSEDLPHVFDDVVRFERRTTELIELAAFGKEVVVRIDDEQSGHRLGLLR